MTTSNNNFLFPLALAISFSIFIISTPANLALKDYALALCIVYALAFKSMFDNCDKYFILVGYLFWTAAYILQIYVGIRDQISTWPLFCGSFYVINEFLTCCTSVFEETSKEERSHSGGVGAASTSGPLTSSSRNGNDQKINLPRERYVTPKYVRVGYYVYLILDLVLNMITVYYGTGSDYDELGLLPMKTTKQRLGAFAFYCTCTLALMIRLSTQFGPRQAKYYMSAFHYVCHLSTLRLPVFASRAHSECTISAILKLQTFGSAFYVVRIKAPTEPKVLFRILLVGMTPFCAWATTATPFVASFPVGVFRCAITAWLVSFWPVLTMLIRMQEQQQVSTFDIADSAALITTMRPRARSSLGVKVAAQPAVMMCANEEEHRSRAATTRPRTSSLTFAIMRRRTTS